MSGEPCDPITPINFEHYISMLKQFKYRYKDLLMEGRNGDSE